GGARHARPLPRGRPAAEGERPRSRGAARESRGALPAAARRRPAAGRARGAARRRALPRPARRADGAAEPYPRGRRRARPARLREVPDAHPRGDPDARRRRQVDGAPLGRAARRARARVAAAHRPHPRAGRALRHAAAAADRRGRGARRARGRAPGADGGGMEVKAGYKQTEVGVIPEDWEVESLGDLVVKVGSGITPRGGHKVYQTHGRPFVRSQNVGWGSLLLDDVVYVDEAIHSTFAETEIHD